MTNNRLGKFFNLTRFAVSLPFFAGMLSALPAVVPTANAQWNQSFLSSNPISCIRWLQDEGARLSPPPPVLPFHKGVCGGGRSGQTNQFIAYCNSSGTGPGVWTQATVNPPGSWTDGYISDFAFKDTLTGWAAVYGAASGFYNNPLVSGIMKTTDGGATWTFLQGAPPEVRGLYYSTVTHRLFCSSGDVDDIGNNMGLQGGAWFSTNDGATWDSIRMNPNWRPIPNSSSVPRRCYYTGFASWDGLHIVLATEGNPNSCSGAGLQDIPFWLYSADGGLTWKTSGMTERSWQPVALKNTSNLYASSYDQTLTPPQSKMLMSPDNGITWAPVSGFTFSSTAVTEVMGGDPCAIVAPDSNSPGNLISVDDGRTWTQIGGAPEPIPSVDLRTYVGQDSIWIFQNKTLFAIARPASQPVHFSIDSVHFDNSGCFTSDTLVSIYGCNCTPPQNANIQITSSSVTVVSGANNFAVSGLSTPINNFCGPSTFHIQYTPSGAAPDASDITINYTNNGTALTKTIHAFGAGAQSDFTSNLGNKLYAPSPNPQTNSVTFKTVPCQQLDTFITINNPTCADFQIITFDSSGGTASTIWVDKANDVPLPVSVNQRGGSFTIPIHALSTKNGNYNFLIIIRTKSGNTIIEKHYYITMIVNGKDVKPFVRGFDIHLPYACMGKGLDSAVYYFDTTCLSSIISNIHLKNQSDPNFSLDLSKIHFPDTIISSNDAGGAGKTFFIRVPVHMTNREPGDYSDSVIFEDVLTDGTVIRTRAYIHYKIDKAIDYTPIPINGTSYSFNVTPCDSGRSRTFYYRVHDTCGFDATLSSWQTSLSPTGLRDSIYDQHKTLHNGQIDSVTIWWPDGYDTAGPTQQGFIKLWFKNGIDSNSITFRWDGYVTTGATFYTIEAPQSTGQTLTRGCDSLVVIDSLFNNSCVVDVRVDNIRIVSGPTTHISVNAGDTILNQKGIPMRIVYTPSATDSGQICGLIYIFVTDMQKKETHLDSVHWCVNVNVKPKSASVTSITGKTLPCDVGYDTTVCVKNTATCGEPVTFTGASTTAQGVTLTNVPFPVTLAPGETKCFNVHVQPPANTPNAGTISGKIDITGDIPQSVDVNFPYEACSHATTLKFDTTGRTLIVTPRCVIANDTIPIFDSIGDAPTLSVSMAPIPAGFTFTPPTVTSMKQGDRTFFVVTFNPDLGTSATGGMVTITYTDGDGNSHTVTVPISAQITGSHYNTSLSISTARATKIKPDMKDTQDFTITLQGTQPVPLSTGVQELQIKMKYNTNILIPQGSGPTILSPSWSAGNPYSVIESNESNGNIGVLTFSVKPTADLTPGTPIAKVTMAAAVSDQTSTVVTIDTGIYNPTDVNFTRCTLTASSAGDKIAVAEDLSCTDSLTNVAMQGKLTPADHITIVPNPAHKSSGAAANLSFRAAVDADGAVDIVDLTGKTVAELAHGALSHGEHIYAIPTPTLSEGTYFARIQIGGFTVVRKFVLQKD